MKPIIKPFRGKIGVAVSGGMDSMCLLDVMRKTQKNIVVINIEHGIRGEESVSDSLFVSSYCKLIGVPCLQYSVDTLNQLQPGESVELTARRLRYEVFDRLLAEKTVDAVALAHHAEDNAETILMRIFRGTGVRGLIGMGERYGYIRPLLGVPHKEIEKYVEEHGIPFVTDSTNLTDDCTRNYIRHEIMPRIKVLYPNVIDAFVRLSENAKETDSYLLSCAPDSRKTSYGYIIKDCFEYPKIIQKYAVRKFFESIGIFQDIEKTHYDSVIELGKKTNNTITGFPFGYRVLKMNADLCISSQHFYPYEKKYEENGTYEYAGYSYRFERGDGLVKGCTLNPDAVPAGCVVRTRLDGDTFRRVHGKNKLLSDFLNEKKLNAFQKEKILVLAQGSTVYAVLGIETAESVKVAENGVFLIVKKEEICP